MGNKKSGLKKGASVERNEKANYNSKHAAEIAEYNYKFINRLKIARETQGMTQAEAAKKLDISLATYRKYEQASGNRTDTAHYIATLAKTFNVSADYLVGIKNTPHPEYDEVIKTTGLNDKSINQLQTLLSQDGDRIYHGYLDFINCFLGNGVCTSLFFEGLLPILRELSDSIYGDYKSERLSNIASAQLADYIYDYITKVVVPTFSQLYNTGEYMFPDVEQYLTDTTVKSKKKKG